MHFAFLKKSFTLRTIEFFYRKESTLMNHVHHHEHEEHSGSLFDELVHHAPYAIFSVAASLILLSFMTGFMDPVDHHHHGTCCSQTNVADSLFHSFHFLHILFASTGTVITYLRFSKNLFKGSLIGLISPAFFCTLSDAVLPYYGGRLLGIPMHWHVCFYSELANVLPFLLVGIMSGIIMGRHHYSSLATFSVSSHFVHILVSSMAASFFLVAHGFTHWIAHIGMVFIFLIIAVLVPCTVSDVVVPMLFAKVNKKK
jgi:hypothetical protein